VSWGLMEVDDHPVMVGEKRYTLFLQCPCEYA
jgi:hypothetical protein